MQAVTKQLQVREKESSSAAVLSLIPPGRERYSAAVVHEGSEKRLVFDGLSIIRLTGDMLLRPRVDDSPDQCDHVIWIVHRGRTPLDVGVFHADPARKFLIATGFDRLFQVALDRPICAINGGHFEHGDTVLFVADTELRKRVIAHHKQSPGDVAVIKRKSRS